ncbi:MAG: hypothetical protein AVDCRST_MAG93-6935, partial [uncultured Chloroflexia bacterium]
AWPGRVLRQPRRGSPGSADRPDSRASPAHHRTRARHPTCTLHSRDGSCYALAETPVKVQELFEPVVL